MTFIRDLLRQAASPLLIVALGAGVTLYGLMQHYKRQAIVSGLRADSLEAAADTTRDTVIGAMHLLERRAIQAEIKADSLDRRLRATSALRAVARIVPVALDTAITADTTTSDSIEVRRAVFMEDREPYHLRFTVTIPPFPATSEADVSIWLDTAEVGIRAVCGVPKAGVRPATIALTTPWWLSVRLDSTRVTPIVCNDDLEDRLKPRPMRTVAYGVALGAMTYGFLRLIF